MKDFLITVISLSSMISTITGMIFAVAIIEGDLPLYFLTPREMYDNTGLNWLGVALSFVCLFPFLSFYYIGSFIHWVCHLGKKRKE